MEDPFQYPGADVARQHESMANAKLAHLEAGIRAGQTRGYASSAPNAPPAPAGMTERITQRLAAIIATTTRSHNVLNEKHCAQFGQPSPSGVTELRKGTPETGPGYAEALVFALLDQLQDRAADVEAAAESLTSRI